LLAGSKEDHAAMAIRDRNNALTNAYLAIGVLQVFISFILLI
jgi:hypothetical protein